MIMIALNSYKKNFYEWLKNKTYKYEKHGVIYGFYTFMYDGPGKCFNMVGYLYNNENVTIIKKESTNWTKVKRENGQEGWITSMNCSKSHCYSLFKKIYKLVLKYYL